MVGSRLISHVQRMKPKQFSPAIGEISVKAPNPKANVKTNTCQPAAAPSPAAVIQPAGGIYQKQVPPPGPGEKSWRDAGAQLLGGVERESQMHPGSSLFTTEH
jgi:hypothetical protein